MFHRDRANAITLAWSSKRVSGILSESKKLWPGIFNVVEKSGQMQQLQKSETNVVADKANAEKKISAKGLSDDLPAASFRCCN
jgi:hypothetical protein